MARQEHHLRVAELPDDILVRWRPERRVELDPLDPLQPLDVVEAAAANDPDRHTPGRPTSSRGRHVHVLHAQNPELCIISVGAEQTCPPRPHTLMATPPRPRSRTTRSRVLSPRGVTPRPPSPPAPPVKWRARRRSTPRSGTSRRPRRAARAAGDDLGALAISPTRATPWRPPCWPARSVRAAPTRRAPRRACCRPSGSSTSPLNCASRPGISSPPRRSTSVPIGRIDAARLLEQLGRPREAGRLLEKAITHGGAQAPAHLALGELLSRLGQHEGAARRLQVPPRATRRSGPPPSPAWSTSCLRLVSPPPPMTLSPPRATPIRRSRPPCPST